MIAQSKGNLQYMLQLDSLRAIAVVLVIFEHWPEHSYLIEEINPGYIGVSFFFVLSGFLISSILIKNKFEVDHNNKSALTVLKQFIIRRAIRIFPIYYLTILIFLILGLSGIGEKVWWYLFYGSNFYLFSIQHWDGPLTHLWTLAIEEQFYIFWPSIILFTSQKHLFKVICGFIVMSVFFRLGVSWYSVENNLSLKFVGILTPSCFDSFGVGALLALNRYSSSESLILKQLISKKYLPIALLVGYFILVYIFGRHHIVNVVLLPLIISIISVLIISTASIGYKSLWIKSLLENNGLVYMGKISYGIYLYHNLIPYFYLILNNFAQKHDLTIPGTDNLIFPIIENSFLKYLLYLIVLLIASHFSWQFIEKPINSLKKRFAY